MANSKIILTFNADLNLNQAIRFTVDEVVKQFVWKIVRSNSGQVTKGIPTINPGERSAINFVTAFNLDWNFNNSSFAISRSLNTVTIESNFYTVEFLNFIPIEDINQFPFTLSPDVTGQITNNAFPLFVIETISFSESPIDKCEKVKVIILTNELSTKIIQPISIPVNLSNPIEIVVLRNTIFNFRAENAQGQTVKKKITIPPLLNQLLFDVVVNNSPFGGTVVINSTVNDNSFDENQLILQYSLDNVNYQNSNEFIGLAVGNYIAYIKDNLGCLVTKNFEVNEFGIQSPYFYISKSNSFRFANRITFGDSENYKNDENTLSCEVDVNLPYKEIQHFQSADIITTQFKSNYSSNIASVVKEDESIVNIPIIRKTNNIGIKDKRDARKYNVGSGKTGVYFISGNTYNYDNNSIIAPYLLNGLLPEWAIIGNYFSIGTSFYLIEEIIFDESKNSDVIVFSNTHIGVEVNVIAGSIYNRFDYEVYEFDIDMVDYIQEKFRVKLENLNPNFTIITHLSEVIFCKIKHENVLEIRYRNTTNTDILYSTGIEHKIRIPYTKISGKSDEESQVHKTDTNAILLNAELYEVDEFEFEPMTKEMWRKASIALSHERVLINGIGYVKNGSLETEGPLDETNLYVLTATMIKTGSVYNSQTIGNIDFNGTEVEVPGLISTESGYLRY